MNINNKRILMFIPRMGSGGAERVMATLSNELVNNNYDIQILTLTSDKSFYRLDKKVEISSGNYQLSKNNKVKRTIEIAFNGVKSIFLINKKIEDWQPDIVISFLTHTNVVSTIAKLLNPEIHLIISERAEPRVRGIITRFVTKYTYTLADNIVCQSREVSAFFPKFAHNKIRVIENPINEADLPTNNVVVRRKVIAAIGRLANQKNFSLLINSFSDITEEFPEYRLEIYGGGPLEKELQSEINRLKLSGKISLMGIKEDVLRDIQDVELFVMSSDFEGFPNALVEAMSIGLPVISTDFSTGVARDLIKKENGLTVPVGDREALSLAMKRMLSDEEERREMGNENKKIRERLSKKNIVGKWIDTFEEYYSK